MLGSSPIPPASDAPVPVAPPTLAVPVDQAPSAPPPAAGVAPVQAVPGTGADIVVESRSREGDPLSGVNATSFDATQAVDKAVVGPVARAYGKTVPAPIRGGIRNFLANLREPVVAVNYLLQLKPGKAGETLGRFAINSTIGAVGLFDVAKRKPFYLPRRRNGFANTMGYYGVKTGPFFYLPLIGPTTLRDFVGNTIDQIMGPLTTVKPFNQQEYIVPIALLSALDYRAEFDEEVESLRASRDPYATTRKFYLDRRQAEIDGLRSRRPAGSAVPVPILPPLSALVPASDARSTEPQEIAAPDTVETPGNPPE